jgi:hypothetical protein
MLAIVLVLVVLGSAAVLLHQYWAGDLAEDAGRDAAPDAPSTGAERPVTPARAA